MTGCDGAISHLKFLSLSKKNVEELDSEPFDGEQRGWVNVVDLEVLAFGKCQVWFARSASRRGVAPRTSIVASVAQCV